MDPNLYKIVWSQPYMLNLPAKKSTEVEFELDDEPETFEEANELIARIKSKL